MEITLSMIIERLSNMDYLYFPSIISNTKYVSGISFLQTNHKSLEPDVLYLTDLSYLISSHKGPIPQKMACIKDMNLNYDHKRFENSDVIFFETPIEVFELADRLQDIFCYYSSISDELLAIVEQNKGLQFLVDKISGILGNLVRINDWNFKILAMTSYESKNAELRKQLDTRTIANGYIMNSDVAYADMKYYISKMNQNDQPVLFNIKDHYICPMISYNLKLQNRKVAMITVYQVDNPFTDATSDLIVFLSRIIALELQKNEMLFNGMKYEYLFTDLLNEKSLSHKDIEQISSYLHYSMNNHYFLVVIRSPVPERDGELNYLRTKILQQVQCNLCVIHEHSIVIIFEAESDNSFAENVLSKLQEMLSVRSMRAGISREFSNLSDIRRRYIEAKKAIELAQKMHMEGNIFRYLDLQFHHLIDLCAHQKDIKSYCHPSLFKLMEDDPELSKTLYLFLQNGKCQATTAKELHIQRSSLLYRLRKIEDKMDINLKDYQCMLHLQLSYEILNYLNLDNQ